MNCGACGAACVEWPAAQVICAAGSCVLASCATGHLDCDGLDENGCEVNSASDAANCGACGSGCTPSAHQTPTCEGGKCGGTCVPGWADCNHQQADGCEVDLRADSENCGACGAVCPRERPVCNDARCDVMGCLAGGTVPKRPCEGGIDYFVGAAWVVCAADCATAWISHAAPGGGTFQPREVCRRLGYSSWDRWGYTLNSVCGSGEKGTSCAAPGAPSFTESADMPNLGKGGADGPLIGRNVQWRCVK